MTLLRRLAPAIALPLLAVAFVALVALSAVALRGVRLDLTEQRLHTLSDGTVRILGRIDEPVRLKLFYSEKAARDVPQFRVFADRVVELLEEMASRSGGKVTLEIVDPVPFSEIEDQAEQAGLQGVPLSNVGDKLYFGLVGTNSTAGNASMPFILPDKEAFLEYDVAKLIATLSVDEPPVVALLSGLPTGPGRDPVTGQPTLGWIVDQELSRRFEIRRLQADPSSIADDVDLLMLVHPKSLPTPTLRAIDQFVLRGGRLLVFVDPDAESDPAGNLLDPVAMAEGRDSDLPELFRAWGIQYDPTKVVLDRKYAMLQSLAGPAAPPVRHFAVLGLHADTLNQKDVVSAQLENLNVSSAGVFALAKESNLKAEPLVQTSADAALVDTEVVRAAYADPRTLGDDFKPDGDGPYLIAARLTGELTTAFPDDTAPGHLAKSAKPAQIILVADTDLLSDRMWVDVQNFLGQPIANAFGDNGSFVYNAVDNLAGDGDLIQVRTRATSTRPFTRLDSIRRTAEQRFRTEEKQLQDQLATLEARLEQLKPAGAGPDAPVPTLSRAQQAELAQFQKQKVATRKALRDVQHQLNADIEAIDTRLRLANIFGIPAVLLLLALVIWGRNHFRRKRAVAG
jgi:ABC-type uncharacterized transport system involved in gliding motility auxiliary subunit